MAYIKTYRFKLEATKLDRPLTFSLGPYRAEVDNGDTFSYLFRDDPLNSDIVSHNGGDWERGIPFLEFYKMIPDLRFDSEREMSDEEAALIFFQS